jgi:hypothetical protein
MQLKTVHNLSLIYNIKITSTATCFGLTWPSSGNCLLFRNRHTALGHNIFTCYCISLFTLNYVCLRVKLSLSSLLFSFCGVHVCAPFVYMYSLVGCMSLEIIQGTYSQLVSTCIRRGHKHGRCKRKITRNGERVLFSNKHISV